MMTGVRRGMNTDYRRAHNTIHLMMAEHNYRDLHLLHTYPADPPHIRHRDSRDITHRDELCQPYERWE